jgi:hypothetical protein
METQKFTKAKSLGAKIVIEGIWKKLLAGKNMSAGTRLGIAAQSY